LKKFIILLLLLVGGIVYQNRNDIHVFGRKLPQVTQSLKSGEFINDIKREISAPGPLRGTLDAINTNLTVNGAIQWTNYHRNQNNLLPVTENKLLNQAAQKKVQDMFAKQYFDHISPEGRGPSDLVEDVGYEYITVGENLALGNYGTDEKLIQAWMNSPGHRANILSAKFTEIGIAVGKGKYEGKTVWLAVQTFAKPASLCPKVDADLKARVDTNRTDVDSLEIQIKRLKDELENSNPQTKQEYDEHNRKVGEYNALIRMYNNKIDILKDLVADYNAQVNAYNACLEK
jgi:uncharacterized protein YkwD